MSKRQIKTWQEAHSERVKLIQSLYELFDSDFKDLEKETKRLANPELKRQLNKLKEQAIAAYSNIKTINNKFLKIAENVLVEKIFKKENIKL